MGHNELDFLLTRMPEIATAVNAFSSESTQQQALSALLAAFSSGPGDSKRSESERPLLPEPRPQDAEAAAPARQSEPQSVAVNASPASSFADFVAWKKPGDNQSKFAVAIYWLKQNPSHAPVSSDDIRRLFRTTEDWREPRNLNSALSVCASRKATIDVSNRADLKLTPKGRYFVENELPRAQKRA